MLGVADRPDPLADLPAPERRLRTHDAIKRLLLRETLNKPLMVVVEDLHWIDEATQEVLNLLAESLGAARMLLLVNYRPEYADPWHGRSCYTQVRLDGLSESSAEAMMSALLGEGADLAPLKRLIVERTDGNPFFIEESVLTLFDEGILVRDGVVRLTQPLVGLKIPPTVQAILAARIDRLTADRKDLLQTLAVIGRNFSLSLVAVVTGIDALSLGPMLSALQQAEFIYEQPALGDVEYAFKHALTHDVAYASLLNERRRALHNRTATALETLHAGTSGEDAADLSRVYTLLAHHLEEAGELSRAADYLRLESARVFAFSLVDQSVEIGLHAARLAGADLPSEGPELQGAIGAELERIGVLLDGRQPHELAALPPLDDPLVGQRIFLLLVTAPFAHQGERLELFTLLVCTALRLTLEHGQGPLAPDVFAMYSIVYSAVSGDHLQAAAWSQLGLDLQGDARGAGFSRCAFMRGWFHNHWVAPLAEGIALAEMGADAGLADGEPLYGCFNLSAALVFEGAAGRPLPDVIASARAKIERNGRRVLNAYCHLVQELQFAKAMAQQTRDMLSLGDEEFDETADIDFVLDSGLSNQIGYYFVIKTKLHPATPGGLGRSACLGRARQACDASTAAPDRPPSSSSVQYRDLARPRQGVAFEGCHEDKPALIAQGHDGIGALRGWAELNPDLFAHKADLLEGVLHAAQGQQPDAERLLQRAAAGADAGGFLQGRRGPSSGVPRPRQARDRGCAWRRAGRPRCARSLWPLERRGQVRALMTREFQSFRLKAARSAAPQQQGVGVHVRREGQRHQVGGGDLAVHQREVHRDRGRGHVGQ